MTRQFNIYWWNSSSWWGISICCDRIKYLQTKTWNWKRDRRLLSSRDRVGGWSKLRLNIEPHFTYCFKIMTKVSASGIDLIYSTWNRWFIVWRAICPLLVTNWLGRPCSYVGNIQARMNQINLDWIKVGSCEVDTRKNTSTVVTMRVNVVDLFLVNEVKYVIIYLKKTRN